MHASGMATVEPSPHADRHVLLPATAACYCWLLLLLLLFVPTQDILVGLLRLRQVSGRIQQERQPELRGRWAGRGAGCLDAASACAHTPA